MPKPGREYSEERIKASEAIGRTFEDVESIICNRIGKKFTCELDIGGGDAIVDIVDLFHVDFDGKVDAQISYLQNPRRTEVELDFSEGKAMRCTIVKKSGRSGEPKRTVLNCVPM